MMEEVFGDGKDQNKKGSTGSGDEDPDGNDSEEDKEKRMKTRSLF